MVDSESLILRCEGLAAEMLIAGPGLATAYYLLKRGRTEQDALVEVVYDFLTRWGLTLDRFEEHHRVFLFDICDRTITKENGELAAGAGVPPELQVVPDRRPGLSEGQTLVRLRRLADEVLRLVEQDLRSFRPDPVVSN